MKHVFLKSGIIAVLTLLMFTGKSQTIQSITIQPASPTPADTILVTVTTSFTSGPCPLTNVSTLFEQNTFSYFVTHTLGSATYICESSDTFKIPPQAPGSYTIDYSLGTPGMPGQDLQTASFLVQLPNGIEPTHETTIKIHPNPFTTHDQIHIETGFTDAIGVSMYSINGDLITNRSFEKGVDLIIDGSSVLPGMYLVKIASVDRILVKKLIKVE